MARTPFFRTYSLIVDLEGHDVFLKTLKDLNILESTVSHLKQLAELRGLK